MECFACDVIKFVRDMIAWHCYEASVSITFVKSSKNVARVTRKCDTYCDILHICVSILLPQVCVKL